MMSQIYAAIDVCDEAVVTLSSNVGRFIAELLSVRLRNSTVTAISLDRDWYLT
jgi:hypothetical protein